MPEHRRPEIALIAAVARNGAIGHGNTLLWRLPEDGRWFRAQTTGCPVIMGRKTWDSLPERFRPLPGRRNVVVTRNPQWQGAGAERVGSLDEALSRTADAAKVFVIGGGQLYAQALGRADELELTEIDAAIDGADTHFPAFDRGAFIEVAREPHIAADGTRFAFVHYRRQDGSATSGG